jgi:hypothetical protein
MQNNSSLVSAGVRAKWFKSRQKNRFAACLLGNPVEITVLLLSYSPGPEFNREKNAGKHGILPEQVDFRKSTICSGKNCIIVS